MKRYISTGAYYLIIDHTSVWCFIYYFITKKFKDELIIIVLKKKTDVSWFKICLFMTK